MKLTQTLKLASLLALFPLMITVAQADNNQFPPNNVFATTPAPQQAPTQPMMRMPQPQMNNPAFSNRMAAPYPMPQRPPQSAFNTMRPAPMPQFNPQRMPITQRMPTNGRTRFPMNAPQFQNPRGVAPNNFNNQPRFNTNNNNFPFPSGNLPFMGNNNGKNSFGMPSNPMKNMFGNNNNMNMPFFPTTNNKKRKKAWGTERNIWPDFYTDFTDEAWDKMMSSPRDLGKMPGGWRFPYISMPDPVTVSDAITNQFPPIAEEAGNMADFSDWGIFD